MRPEEGNSTSESLKPNRKMRMPAQNKKIRTQDNNYVATTAKATTAAITASETKKRVNSRARRAPSISSHPSAEAFSFALPALVAMTKRRST